MMKQDLARIARVPAARLSNCLQDQPISVAYAERIRYTVQDIILVWRTFKPIKIALDDPEAFARAVELAH